MWKKAGLELIDLVLLRGISRVPPAGQVMLVLAWVSVFGAPVLLLMFHLGIWP